VAILSLEELSHFGNARCFFLPTILGGWFPKISFPVFCSGFPLCIFFSLPLRGLMIVFFYIDSRVNLFWFCLGSQSGHSRQVFCSPLLVFLLWEYNLSPWPPVSGTEGDPMSYCYLLWVVMIISPLHWSSEGVMQLEPIPWRTLYEWLLVIVYFI